ncbi:MAG: hypothetical protein IJ081_03685 [Prevotella sp.]|nr:hypothetical protein [Prevotella sp.]
MKKIYMIGAVLLMLLTTSCREESDALLSYDHNELLSFGDANESFAGKFKVMWNGMNQYYALWDYEAEQGLDWDAVYDEYLPQFEALDKRNDSIPVTDEELTEMLRKVLSPIHDGHFAMFWKNHATGSTVAYSPSRDRFASRDDAKIANGFTPSLDYYLDPANDEVEMEDGQPIALEYGTDWASLSAYYEDTPGIGMKWIEAEMARIDNMTLPTELDLYKYDQLKTLRTQLEKALMQTYGQLGIPAFNALVQQYSFLKVPGLNTIDPGFTESHVKIKFALLKGNIAYLYFSDFNLTPYLVEEAQNYYFNLQNEQTVAHLKGIVTVWKSWFYAIQMLHKAGKLGGVIIDVRSNGGGIQFDGTFVAGALLPAGGFQFGYSRFKRGTGRYDYSPLMPNIMPTMDEEHEIINDKPVVLLVNSRSVSMSEITAQAVKVMPNGKVIGKRTYGGLCGLTASEKHSQNYAGYIGVEGKTPVYGYVPSLASFTMDKQQLEGVGISPDIEVALDENLFYSPASGRDTQLDRALQYIRTGK